MVEIGPVFLEEKTLKFKSLLWKGRGPSFEQTWIPFIQGCFMLSLFAIGLLVFGEDENAKSLRQRHNKYNNDNDLQRTNFDQKSLLEPSAHVS